MVTVMPKTLHALHHTHETELLLYTLATSKGEYKQPKIYNQYG